MEYNSFKSKFKIHFNLDLHKNPKLKYLLFNIFVYGSAYIVGGYLRDFLNGNKSRDLDIIIDLSNDKLIKIINDSNCLYSINRHGGIKIIFRNLIVDMWSIENNWAFKNELVKFNEEDKLESIAKGCFYNYDSLVINLHTFNLNIQYYNQYLKQKKLEILLKSTPYKNLNPTSEANILRAFYLKKKDQIQFSKDTKKYLLYKIIQFKDKGFAPVDVLEVTKKKYPKYQNHIHKEDILKMISELNLPNKFDKQIYIGF